MALVSINPANGEKVAEYPEQSHAECDAVLESAHTAYHTWKTLTYEQRAAYFVRLAEELRSQSETLAALATVEMGKPIRDSRAEVEKCATACEYYAREAEGLLREEIVETDAQKSYVTYQPIGVILGIMPWNFPFWQVLRYATPIMMAGNTTILKHANNVSGCALAIEKLFVDAGFPENAFRSLIIDIPDVDRVIRHPLIAGVTITGSPRAGKAVASAAGAVLKKCVLELGGSDPFVVLEDADINAAIEAGVSSRLVVSGQVCISPKRFIVPEKIKAEFEEKLVARMSEAIMGNPAEEETTFGPLAREDLRDTVARQVEENIKNGAKCLLGGERPDGPGAYYPATVLTDVQPGMPSYDEEVFGPVAAIISVPNEEEALRVANDTPYGLGAVVFSQDIERAEKMAQGIEAGCCFVNTVVRSDPRLPFGGVKQSGFGRELGACGIKEFTNTKTIYIA
jgi:succinate-semialdehyde dehydrogenase/glutarate-semialdehyde dehydrogenase